MDKKVLHNYKNGNAVIELYEDGTRIVSFEDTLELVHPLNIDIRLSNRCSLGYNPKTGKSTCDFCHESATTDGNRANLEILKTKLNELPSGIELAIGSNELTDSDMEFFKWCKEKGFVVNLTINQLHIKRDLSNLQYLISNDLIKGLGVSLRNTKYYEALPKEIKEYPNMVLHVIAGLDDLDEVLNLSAKKILILGYKQFGNGDPYYEKNSKAIQENIYYWYTNFIRLINVKYLNFDNLALHQLNVKRWVNKDSWDTFYQGEHSMYINAVDGLYSPSSRSSDAVSWESMTLTDYYSQFKNSNKD